MIRKLLAMTICGVASLSSAHCPHAFDLWGGSPSSGYVSDWIGICVDGHWEVRSERGENESFFLPPSDDKQFRAVLADAIETLKQIAVSPRPCPHQFLVRLPATHGARLISVCETSTGGDAALRLHEMARSITSYSTK